VKAWEHVARYSDYGDLICVDCDSSTAGIVFACDLEEGACCVMCRCRFLDGEWKDIHKTALDELEEACDDDKG
jgi:hypothetical protein